MVKLEGKVVLVTGASRGIGAASARAFAEAGAVVGMMARDESAVNALAAEIGGLSMSGDVAQATDMKRAVARMCDRFGRLDDKAPTGSRMSHTDIHHRSHLT